MLRRIGVSAGLLSLLAVASGCGGDVSAVEVAGPAPTPTAARAVEPVGAVVGDAFDVPPSTGGRLIVPARVPDELDVPGVEVGVIEPPVTPTPVADEAVPEEPTCDLWMSIPADVINFADNSAEIGDHGVAYLRGVASTFPEARRIDVVGHASADGDADHNQDLSERRAVAVAGVLAALFGEEVEITAEGRGETQPIATNETAEGREANRRVELVLEVPDTTCNALEQP